MCRCISARLYLKPVCQFNNWPKRQLEMEFISHWMSEGLLASESIQRRGQPCRVVLPHQLLGFRQNYIPLAGLGRDRENSYDRAHFAKYIVMFPRMTTNVVIRVRTLRVTL